MHFDSSSSYHERLEIRFQKRINKDLEKGDLEKAISRYEGYFQHNFSNQIRHNEVAQLYIQKGDQVRAGKHLFLKENLLPVERECIELFEKSCGNNPTRILKKYIPKEGFRIKELNLYAKLRMKQLVKESALENGATPNFLKAYERHLVKVVLK